jgi:hypothetical protein
MHGSSLQPSAARRALRFELAKSSSLPPRLSWWHALCSTLGIATSSASLSTSMDCGKSKVKFRILGRRAQGGLHVAGELSKQIEGYKKISQSILN